MNKRWIVRCRARDGREIGTPHRYWTRRGALRAARFDERTALGLHPWNSGAVQSITAVHGPLFTVEVCREGQESNDTENTD